MNTSSDEYLLEKIKQRDKKAFKELVHRYSNLLFKVSFRFLYEQEASEDIVQDFFYKLWKDPSKYREQKGSKFKSWAYRVVTNLSLDQQKKIKTLEIDETNILNESISLEDELEKKMRFEFLKKMIKSLPEKQQIALNLCFFEGLSNKEAADSMDESVKAIESMIFRAKKSLQKKVEIFKQRS